MARDDAGNIYVSDYWDQWIQKFGPDGKLVATWGLGRGAAPGTLNLPAGIEVDNTRGFLYIANREQRVVDRWRLSDGTFSARYIMPPGAVDEKGWLRDVAVDEASGRVYAVDDRNNQVVIFTRGGAVRRIITTAGGARLGQVRSVDSGPDGLIYVGDASNRMVHVYTAAGDHVRSFPVLDPPNGISVTASKVFVLSYQVLEYSLHGALLQQWSATGTGNGELLAPYVGIVAAPTGEVITGDSGNHRVKVFG